MDEKRPESSPHADDTAVLTWTTHPLKRRLWVSVAVTLFILVIAVMVHAATESRIFTVLSLIVLFGSLSKFYFPTTYRLSETTLSVRTTTHTLVRNWSQYRTCYPDKNGILLSPFIQPSRLENFRGLYLMFEGNGDAVTPFVRTRLEYARKADHERHPDSSRGVAS